MRLPLFFFVAGLLAVAAGIPCRAAETIWWEAEKPLATNFPARSAFSADTLAQTRERLSGGDWLSNSGKRAAQAPAAFASYSVLVADAGEYQFWARKFWKHGPFEWRFDGGAWTTCGRDIALADDTPLRTHVGANWVHLGQVKLTAGAHRLEIRLLAKPGEDLTAAFDCFVLAPGVFVPSGKLKPGERSGQADEGFFAYEPGIDPFTADALLDLRSINEATAGQNGPLRARGDQILLGDSTPVRFLAVNCGYNIIQQDPDAIDYLARRLGKAGVNMVRAHGPLFDINSDPASQDGAKLDALMRFVAAMKRQGIYTTISFYFPLWFSARDGGPLEGYEGRDDRKPFAALFFNPQLQERYRQMARRILDTPSPYGKSTLGADPAVGIVELINEDSFFFWTFNRKAVPPAQWKLLESQYHQWLTRRYGSIDKAVQSWATAKVREDQPGRPAILDAWNMTADGIRAGGADKRRRMADQARFLAETQRDFYDRMRGYLKDDLKFTGLVVGSNWTVADPATLDAIERWTYTSTDVLDQHGYFEPLKHQGEGASYSVRIGHTFGDKAAVEHPRDWPLRLNRIEGHPSIISELGWNFPNRRRTDYPLVVGAYSALQGASGVYLFAVNNAYLNDSAMAKFSASDPLTVIGLPIMAMLFRRGDVRQAEPVARQALTLERMFSLDGAGWASAPMLDALRQSDVPAGAAAGAALDPLTYLVGPVVRTIGQKPGESYRRDLSKFIDPSARRVSSATGELTLDWGKGLLTVNTPRTQAIGGFLSRAGRVDLRDVSIECDNEFASVAVTALDGRPLAESRRILVQVIPEEQPYGFAVEGGRITAVGAAPFGLRKISVRVELPVRPESRVAGLDENGYPVGRAIGLSPVASGTRARFAMPENVCSVIVQP